LKITDSNRSRELCKNWKMKNEKQKSGGKKCLVLAIYTAKVLMYNVFVKNYSVNLNVSSSYWSDDDKSQTVTLRTWSTLNDIFLIWCLYFYMRFINRNPIRRFFLWEFNLKYLDIIIYAKKHVYYCWIWEHSHVLATWSP
jgi:hypothetical protein